MNNLALPVAKESNRSPISLDLETGRFPEKGVAESVRCFLEARGGIDAFCELILRECGFAVWASSFTRVSLSDLQHMGCPGSDRDSPKEWLPVKEKFTRAYSKLRAAAAQLLVLSRQEPPGDDNLCAAAYLGTLSELVCCLADQYRQVGAIGAEKKLLNFRIRLDAVIAQERWPKENSLHKPPAVAALGVSDLLVLRSRVTDLGLRLRKLYTEGTQLKPAAQVPERVRRGDAAFDYFKQCYFALADTSGMVSDHTVAPLAEWLLLDSYRKALRYNRESPVFNYNAAVDVIPADQCRNFNRSELERMYFLALHGLPSSYDFFCCTYTVTRCGYRQEKHLHRFSDELTVVLDGEANCVWYDCTEGGPRKMGAIRAQAFEAFRVPAGVVHAIENENWDNKNITVKLTGFIDDRLGEQDWEFAASPKRRQPALLDKGAAVITAYGRRLTFDHSHQGLKFKYQLDIIEPGGRMTLSELSSRYLFVAAGGGILAGKDFSREVADDVIIKINTKEVLELSARKRPLVVFSVPGLDPDDFVKQTAKYQQYEPWYLSNLRWTLG